MHANPNRRTFVKQTVASATTVASITFTTPSLLGLEKKSGSAVPILGTGEYQYAVHHNCMQLPDHIRWQETHGVAVDAAGLVYVKHRTKTVEPMDAVVVFDGEGKFVRSFGKQFHGGGHGIDLRQEGNEQFLYLSDNKGYISKTTLTGEVVWSKTAPALEIYADAKPFQVTTPGKYGKGRRFIPTNIAFAPDGGFFVGDGYGTHYIIRYDAQGNAVDHFGGHGSQPGKLNTPHGLWWDDRPGREPALVVADRANARLQYFTAQGKHLGFVNDLLFPADVDVQGELMLVPDLHARVTLLDKHNQVIAHLGDDPAWRASVLADNFAMRSQPKRWEDGRFVHPHDACFDANGNIYVAEWVIGGRVSKLQRV